MIGSLDGNQTGIRTLILDMLGGSVHSLSQAITLVENENLYAGEILDAVTPHLRKIPCVGITGAAGVGKSTLTDQMIAIAREKGLSVGVIAVDPSSPRHGGAVLGDRIRMNQHALDPEVFIRSMSTRGSYGGLPRCTSGLVRLLNAFGKDMVIVETVGVGQTDCAIADVADMVVLMLSPDSGDSIQFMKAGIMEIADIIVVNKADSGNVERLVLDLESFLALRSDKDRDIPIFITDALNNVGIRELFEELNNRGQAAKETRKFDQR